MIAVTEQQLQQSTKYREDALTSLRLFCPVGSITEIRAPNCKKNRSHGFSYSMSGYFDTDHFEDALKSVNGLSVSHNAPSIYVLLNPPRRDLLARSANKIHQPDKGETTKDLEIVNRRWVLVDCDPVRPAGISSNEIELLSACDKIKEVGLYLQSVSFPRPVIAMSGNGYHLLYRIDLPTDDGGLVERFLKSLDQKFSSETVKIDTSVHNAARITKLYGTMAKKGDSIPDRPHRRSELIEVPEVLEVVPRELIESVAAEFVPQSRTTTTANPAATKSHSGSPSLERYLHRHNIPILKTEETSDATRFYVTCPGESWHTSKNASTDCCVSQAHNGTLGAKCVHDSCGVHSWQDFKSQYGPITKEDYSPSTLAKSSSSPSAAPELFAPGTVVKCGDKDNIGTVLSDNGGSHVTIHFVSPEGNEATVEIPRNEVVAANSQSKAITIRAAGDLVRDFPELRPYIIEGLIRQGETMNIIASPKTGKSWLSMGLALSIIAGRKWLERFWTKRGKVLIVDNELHPETSAHRLPWIAKSMQIPTEDYANNLFVANLRGELIDMKKLAVQLGEIKPGEYSIIILDAWYRFQPEGTDENSNSDVAALYNLLDSVAGKINCAFVCIHHSSKGNQASKGVTDVGSGAGAQARAPDAHLVMRQHEEDGAVVVDAAVRSFAPVKSFCLRWKFPVWELAEDLDPMDIRKEKSTRKSADDEVSVPGLNIEQSNQLRVLEFLEMTPEGETKSQIANGAGLSGAKYGPVHMSLLKSKSITACQIQKTRRKPFDGFAITKGGNELLGQLRQLGQSDSSDQSDYRTQTTAPPLGGSPSLSTSPTTRNDERCGLFV